MENSNLEQFFHLFSTILRLKEKRETKASSLDRMGEGVKRAEMAEMFKSFLR